MGKHTKIVLLLFVAAQAFLVAPLFARAITENDYSTTPEKIYKDIDTITFTFSGSYFYYSVIMASKFQSLNSTHASLRLDIFIETDDGTYVTSLPANISYNATFTVNNQIYRKNGTASDQSSFYQTDDLLYTFELGSVAVPSNIFPTTVSITLIYTIQSTKFVKSGIATASNNYLGPTIMQIIVYGIIAVVILAIVFGVRAKRRRPGGGGYKPKAVSPMPATPIMATNAPPATAQAMPPTYGTPVQTGVPASMIGMASPPGTPPPAESSPMICPACGGNVVNSKCQSCGSLVCRGCGHINAAGGHFCEKCGKNL